MLNVFRQSAFLLSYILKRNKGIYLDCTYNSWKQVKTRLAVW